MKRILIVRLRYFREVLLNFYNKKVGRFPAIDEDEEPYRLLCNEYPKVL